MKALPFFATVLLAVLYGCSHRVPVGTVEVIDTSLSVTPRAEQATMDAARAQIRRMERGDIHILVPITGDELNDAGGGDFCASRHPLLVSRTMRTCGASVWTPQQGSLHGLPSMGRNAIGQISWEASISPVHE